MAAIRSRAWAAIRAVKVKVRKVTVGLKLKNRLVSSDASVKASNALNILPEAAVPTEWA